MTRVVIDTDGVRTLAQYARGAIDQVAHIRLELMRAERELNHQVGADAYGPLLARLTDFVTVLTDDHRMLVQEVLTLEAEEGVVGAAVWTDTNIHDPGVTTMELVSYAILPMLSLGAASLPPPGPWNTAWVTAGGAIPVGSQTRPLTTAEQQPGQQDGFGPRWEPRSASVDFSHEEGIRSSTSQDADGTHSASWELYQRAAVEARAHAEGSDGDVHYRADAVVGASESVSVHVWASAGPDGAAIGGEAVAQVHVYGSASGEVGVDGVGGVSGGVEGDAGAEAHAAAGAAVDDDGVSAGYGVGAYAGAQGGAGVGGEVGPVSGEYGVRAGVGVGVEVGGGFSFDIDDIGFDFNATLGLGLSLGIDLSFHISPSGIWDGIEAAFDGENPLEASDDEWEEQAEDQSARAVREGEESAGRYGGQDTILDRTGDPRGDQP